VGSINATALAGIQVSSTEALHFHDHPLPPTTTHSSQTTTKMKLSFLFSILPLALQSYAADAPEPAAAKLTLGPAPITELRPQVEKFNANRELLGNFTLSAQAQAAAACGVYLCEHPNFQGQCYWGCYPLGTPIYPDTYWVFRLSSVGPDPGARVVAN